jgi:threonine synthase
MNWEFACDTCNFRSEPDQPLWCCPQCGSALHVEGLDSLGDLNLNATGMWRYDSALPTNAPARGTILGEGATPLIPVEIDGFPIHLKMDSHMPSGSFKDRGAAAMATYLHQIGVKRIIVDSSGNAAAAMSAYAAALGLDCTVYVPSTASPGKMVQARAYGSTVIPVEGSREDVAQAAQSAAENDSSATYASHNYHPVFVEGVKTWAIEVWEQLGSTNPDVVYAPSGGGSSFVGAWRGFVAVGGSMPQLVLCQPSACAPIHKAWQAGTDIEPVPANDTIAEGTKISMPSRPKQILNALRNGNGATAAIDDAYLIDTLKLLWSQGVYVEPTAGLGVAACRQAISAGKHSPDQRIVAHITGNGLKATTYIQELLG